MAPVATGILPEEHVMIRKLQAPGSRGWPSLAGVAFYPRIQQRNR